MSRFKKVETAWKFNYNYWTGATRQDFPAIGSQWCPMRVNVSSPWELIGAKNASLIGKADCIAFTVGRIKSNVSTQFFGNLTYRNCSQRQMLACRVHFYEIYFSYFLYSNILFLKGPATPKPCSRPTCPEGIPKNVYVILRKFIVILCSYL